MPWNGRSYKVEDFESSDTVNKALSAANTSLYGVVHAIIVALGCSPGLGFVHARNERSFVYDIADLYKVEITVPLAFDLAAEEPPDIGVAARRAVRDRMRDGRFMQRCVHGRPLPAHRGRRRGWRTPLPGPASARNPTTRTWTITPDVDDIPSDIAEHPDDDDEDYRDELNLWAGRQGMVAGRTNYAQSPRSHVTGGAGADADDPLGDAFGPWEDAEPSSDDDMGVDPWS